MTSFILSSILTFSFCIPVDPPIPHVPPDGPVVPNIPHVPPDDPYLPPNLNGPLLTLLSGLLFSLPTQTQLPLSSPTNPVPSLYNPCPHP